MTQPSGTGAGWLIAASPLVLMGIICLAATAGFLAWMEVVVIVAAVAGVNYLAASHDTRVLTERGFRRVMSKHSIWATPLIYLVIRARRTSDDFDSYRLVWANFGFTVASFVVVVGAIYAATWSNGMASLHP